MTYDELIKTSGILLLKLCNTATLLNDDVLDAICGTSLSQVFCRIFILENSRNFVSLFRMAFSRDSFLKISLWQGFPLPLPEKSSCPPAAPLFCPNNVTFVIFFRNQGNLRSLGKPTIPTIGMAGIHTGWLKVIRGDKLWKWRKL